MAMSTRSMLFSSFILMTALLCAHCGAQQVLVQGRVEAAEGETVSLPVVLSWAVSTVSFSIRNSTSVTINFEPLPEGRASLGYSDFRVELDGRELDYIYVQPHANESWTYHELTQDLHHISLIKLTEARYGRVLLQGIELSSTGSFEAPVPPVAVQSGRRIQYLGDSYTNGWGNLGNSSCHLLAPGYPQPEYQDATLTWGALSAAQLTADFQLIAWAGAAVEEYPSLTAAGVPVAEWPAYEPKIQTLVGQEVAGENTTLISNFSQWVPQLVVLAGGTNDFHEIPTEAEWISQYIDFIEHINDVYDGPTLAIVTYPAAAENVGVLKPSQTVAYEAYMGRLEVALSAMPHLNTHFLHLSAEDIDLSDWCVLHPNAAAHAAYAEQFVPFVKGILPEWAEPFSPASALA